METYEQLQQMTDSVLIDKINRLAPHVGAGVDFYMEELARRRTNESSDRLERMTANIERLTKRITVLTVVSVATSAAAVFVTLVSL